MEEVNNPIWGRCRIRVLDVRSQIISTPIPTNTLRLDNPTGGQSQPPRVNWGNHGGGVNIKRDSRGLTSRGSRPSSPMLSRPASPSMNRPPSPSRTASPIVSRRLSFTEGDEPSFLTEASGFTHVSNRQHVSRHGQQQTANSIHTGSYDQLLDLSVNLFDPTTIPATSWQSTQRVKVPRESRRGNLKWKISHPMKIPEMNSTETTLNIVSPIQVMENPTPSPSKTEYPTPPLRGHTPSRRSNTPLVQRARQFGLTDPSLRRSSSNPSLNPWQSLQTSMDTYASTAWQFSAVIRSSHLHSVAPSYAQARVTSKLFSIDFSTHSTSIPPPPTNGSQNGSTTPSNQRRKDLLQHGKQLCSAAFHTYKLAFYTEFHSHPCLFLTFQVDFHPEVSSFVWLSEQSLLSHMNSTYLLTRFEEFIRQCMSPSSLFISGGRSFLERQKNSPYDQKKQQYNENNSIFLYEGENSDEEDVRVIRRNFDEDDPSNLLLLCGAYDREFSSQAGGELLQRIIQRVLRSIRQDEILPMGLIVELLPQDSSSSQPSIPKNCQTDVEELVVHGSEDEDGELRLCQQLETALAQNPSAATTSPSFSHTPNVTAPDSTNNLPTVSVDTTTRIQLPLHHVFHLTKVFLRDLQTQLPLAPPMDAISCERLLTSFVWSLEKLGVFDAMNSPGGKGIADCEESEREIWFSQTMIERLLISLSLWSITQAIATQVLLDTLDISLKELRALRKSFFLGEDLVTGGVPTKDLSFLLWELGMELNEEEMLDARSVLDPHRVGTFSFSNFVRWWCQ